MKIQLQSLRKAKGLTQEEAANIFDVKLSTYQKYERDVVSPTYKTLIKIADFYGVSTDYLLGREPAEQTNPILYLTQEEMEQRLLKAYFSLPQKLRDDFLKSMADQLEKQHKTVTRAADDQQLKSESSPSIIVKTAARAAHEGEYKLIHEEQMTPEDAEKKFAELESYPDADDDM